MPSAGHAYALVDNCGDDNCTNNPGNDGNAYYATLGSPGALDFDAQGDLVIGDGGNYMARFVPATAGFCYGKPMAAGNIYALAGNGTGGGTSYRRMER